MNYTKEDIVRIWKIIYNEDLKTECQGFYNYLEYTEKNNITSKI
jgi:hypothetical protein